MDELEDRIRQRAYELWEREGRPEGRALQHWDQAAREVQGESGVEPRRAAPLNETQGQSRKR
ncbi:MAG: DUF2934 domain-containing protein [Alphaproteobacteria bacterium]|nr:DUF2934 domain-containing protein [Alphaproteobacteria bacterium]